MGDRAVTGRKTPVVPSGSGEFLKDQSRNGMRQLQETFRECPRCDGSGEIRTVNESATQYRVQIAECKFCEGVGCVPKWKVA